MDTDKSGAGGWFRKIRQSLDASFSDSEREAISFIILEHLGVDRFAVFADRAVELRNEEVEPVVRRINAGEPPQYVLGWSMFHGLRFEVDSSVLIPRPETEMLVDMALGLSVPADAQVWDLATGSGAVAVALANARPHWNVSATDISAAALEVAARNAARHQASVNLMRHDLLSVKPPFSQKADLILSNPPYIGLDEKPGMEARVWAHEPSIALFAPADDVLAFYRSLAQIASVALRTGGYLMVEINQRFGEETVAIFRDAGFGEVQLVKDLSGHDRIVICHSDRVGN